VTSARGVQSGRNMEQRLCPHCGGEVDEETVVCPHCGESLVGG
jgi:RNA polymerase subunit RPABC4/transcription elongation factor Spt4